MSTWPGIAILTLSFIIPIIFAERHRKAEGFVVGALFAVVGFIALGVATTETTYEPVSRSQVFAQRMTVDGQSKLYVMHPEGTFRTTDAYLYENFEDTTKVEVVVKVTDDIWRGRQSAYLVVRPK